MRRQEYEWMRRVALQAGPRGVVIVALREGERERQREPLDVIASSQKTLEGEGSPEGAIVNPGDPDAETRCVKVAFNAAELAAYCESKLCPH